jgi:hypothetical protein
MKYKRNKERWTKKENDKNNARNSRKIKNGLKPELMTKNNKTEERQRII